MSENRQPGLDRAKLGSDPFSELCRKIVLLIAEDTRALSHFRPLIALLKEVAHSIVVVTRSSGRLGEIEAMGVRVIDFDYRLASTSPMRRVALPWAVGRILEAESPDVVHLVALEPVLLGGLALKLVPAPHVVVHVPGFSPFANAAGDRLSRFCGAGALRLMASMLRRPSSYLLVDSAEDLAQLRARGVDSGARFAVLGGVGVDPLAFPALPVPANDVPVAAFVGRMTQAKGVDVLMRAQERLHARGVPLRLEFCGGVGADDNEAIAADTLTAWCAQHKATRLGHVGDVREVWRRADICVLPACSGGALPRALVEAAACARPLIVTDVPGPRQFVRDGVEGIVVPPQDADALAGALERLARDAELRQRMGEAARLRLLHGFTESHVKQSLKAAYASMLGKTLRS
jgi:glycosyltransferase involved in cell wall biosynthesis